LPLFKNVPLVVKLVVPLLELVLLFTLLVLATMEISTVETPPFLLDLEEMLTLAKIVPMDSNVLW